MFVAIKRVIRNGVINFLRNGFISLATMFIMGLTLFSLAFSIYFDAALKSVISQLEDKVDINVYFIPNAPEKDILAIKEKLEKLPEVESVKYVSASEALIKFKQKYKSDTATIKALEELEENPLGASLAVKAKDIKYYQKIAQYLESDSFLNSDTNKNIVEHINYHKNKAIIDRLIQISESAKKVSLAIIIFLGVTAMIITFNTIRLAIYTTKDEISILKLVGASNWYARGPFIIEAGLYGFVSGLFVLAVLYPISIYLDPASLRFFGTFSTRAFYEQNILQLFLVIVGSGVLIGVVSSYFAARKYLKV